MEYDVCYNATASQNADLAAHDDEDDVQPADEPPAEKQYNSVISLQNDMGKMRHRKTRAILMCHKFSQQNEPEKFYHAELMLFTAWRDEERDLLGNFKTYSSSHESHNEEITTVKGRFYRQPEALTEAIDEFFKEGPPHSVWDELASHQRQENAECAEEGPEVERLVDCADDSVLQTTFLDQTSAAAPASTTTSERFPLMTDDEYYNLTRSLNRRQQEVF